MHRYNFCKTSLMHPPHLFLKILRLYHTVLAHVHLVPPTQCPRYLTRYLNVAMYARHRSHLHQSWPAHPSFRMQNRTRLFLSPASHRREMAAEAAGCHRCYPSQRRILPRLPRPAPAPGWLPTDHTTLYMQLPCRAYHTVAHSRRMHSYRPAAHLDLLEIGSGIKASLSKRSRA